VINATDLSPIMEHTQVKEIRELVAPDNKISTRPVEISLKIAELPTTTPIEVKSGNGKSTSTVKMPLRFICLNFKLCIRFSFN
jgi:protein O-GlcNAc transferase